MDPYDILGINPTRDWTAIRSAYKKMLNSTHPDKMGGSAKYFMMVHEAYRQLEQMNAHHKKERNAPKQKQKYTYDLPRENSGPSGPPVSNEGFNAYYDKNAKIINNPYNRGYSSNMVARQNFQEDDKQLYGNKVDIPKRQLVIYKEPVARRNKFTENFFELGVEHIDDFSCSNATDYQRAHSNPEELVDTVQRYQSLDDMKHSRKNADYKLTQEEKRLAKERREDHDRLEAMRRSNLSRHDTAAADHYRQVHRRLRN